MNQRELVAIKKPGELLEGKWTDGPYLIDEIIKVATFGERRLSKKRLALLKVIHPVVGKVLEAEEKVFFVTEGVRTKGIEQLFIGWIAYYYNYMAFAFTFKRVILIHLKSRKKRGVFVGQVEYADIRKVQSSLFGGLILKFRNGSSLYFSRVPRSDRIYLRKFLTDVLGAVAKEKDKTGRSLINLCPRCFRETNDFPLQCEGCGELFKSASKAGWLSLLMPGLGDLYLGSRSLGALELMIMLFLWLGFFIGLSDLSSSGLTLGEYLISNAIFFGILHFCDSLKSAYMGKKGLYPKRAVKHEGE